ncbi:hypothetical protein PENTCL1PPCAC_3490, partial [Pristionchus entomophagus]
TPSMLFEDDELTEPEGIRLNDLPMELLRKIVEPLGPRDRHSARSCCEALEEAVETSNLKCFDMEIKYDGFNTMFEILLDGFELFACAMDTVEFRADYWSNRLFGKLKIHQLTLHDVRPIKAGIRVVNEFLEVTSFDVLIVHLFPDQWLCSRIEELIKKAEMRVDLIMHYCAPTPEQFLTISIPVTINIFHDAIWVPSEDEHFLEPLRRGHSFSSVRISLRSEQTLVEAVKIISESLTIQGIFIHINEDLCQRFLSLTNAENTGQSEDGSVQEYEYRGALISLHENEGDFLVNSPACTRLLDNLNDEKC